MIFLELVRAVRNDESWPTPSDLSRVFNDMKTTIMAAQPTKGAEKCKLISAVFARFKAREYVLR